MSVKEEIAVVASDEETKYPLFGKSRSDLTRYFLWVMVVFLFIIGTYINSTGSFFPYDPEPTLDYKAKISEILRDSDLSKEEVVEKAVEVYKAEMKHVSELKGQFGALGDAFGGLLNPMLTFISIIVVLYTVRQNNRVIEQSMASNRLARLEFSKNQEALNESLKVAASQLKETERQSSFAKKEYEDAYKVQRNMFELQERQRFEHTFFSLFEQNNKFIEGFSAGDLSLRNKLRDIYEEKFHTTTSLDALYWDEVPELYRYLKFLSYVLDLLDSYDEADLYARMILDSIPDDILWACIVVVGVHGVDRDNDLISQFNRYGFLKYLVVMHSGFYLQGCEADFNKIDCEFNVNKGRESVSLRYLKVQGELRDTRKHLMQYSENIHEVLSRFDSDVYRDNFYLVDLLDESERTNEMLAAINL